MGRLMKEKTGGLYGVIHWIYEGTRAGEMGAPTSISHRHQTEGHGCKSHHWAGGSKNAHDRNKPT